MLKRLLGCFLRRGKKDERREHREQKHEKAANYSLPYTVYFVGSCANLNPEYLGPQRIQQLL